MAKTLILPVPEAVRAVCLVAAPLWVPPELGGGPLTRVEAVGGQEPPVPWLVQAGECPDCARCGLELGSAVVERLRAAKFHLRVTATGPASWPPDHLTAAATVAYGLAEQTGGLLIDAATGDLEPWARAPEPFDEPAGFAAAEWLAVECLAEPGPRRAWTLRTRGLAVLGLPELRIRRIPHRLRPGWTDVLMGLAQHLLQAQWADLTRTPAIAFREFPSLITLTTADVGAALATCPHGPGETRLRLRFDPGAPGGLTCLTVCAPGPPAEPAPAWREKALTDLDR